MPDKGIPTAEQEALQAPTIDPVFTAALGPTFGLRTMLQSLAMGALNSSLGAGPGMTKLGMIPGPSITALAKTGLGEHLVAGMGEFIRNDLLKSYGIEATPKEILQFEPDFTSMTGHRGETPQIVDNMQRSLRTMFGLDQEVPYKGAEIGRPAGLAAMIADIKNHFGGSEHHEVSTTK